MRLVNESFLITLWWLNADNVAIEPNGPGLPFGPQQLTGNPAIGSGLFCWFNDCIFRDRLLHNNNEITITTMNEREKLKKMSVAQKKRRNTNHHCIHLPSGCNKYDDSHNNCTTYRCTGRYCNFIHVRCGRWQCAHLAALCVRNTFRCNIELFQRNHAHHNALLRRHIFNFKFTFAGLEWWALLKAFVGK